jgi:hypothetical protein
VITNPSNHFQTILDTGANILTAAQAKFPNGLWWIKDRVNSNQHQLVDSVRGGNLALQTPASGVETAYSAPSGDSVAWCWNAPDAFTSNAGTIASSGRRNVNAGFSIVTYTGNGVAGATVGHDLNAQPKMIIVKNRDQTDPWFVYHEGIDFSIPADYYIVLNTNAARVNSGTAWANTIPTSTVFTLGSNSSVNSNTRNYAAYCWAEVPDYSSFGSYVGNGNADGPFVYTGFRPAFVMIKGAEASGNWVIFDTARNTYNPSSKLLQPNDTGVEIDSSTYEIDILSNGFKVRTSNARVNSSGDGLIYAAFAEHPFGGANVSPSPAR